MTCPKCKAPMYGDYCVCGYKNDIIELFTEIFGMEPKEDDRADTKPD